MKNPPALFLLEGEVLRDVLVSPEDMARMNEARATFKELRAILMGQIIPALGGFNNPIATEIEVRVESIILKSGNFLWRYRYIGAAHTAMSTGGFQ